jgi:Cu(I)/Ag(I) efflux system membrane fusion protein
MFADVALQSGAARRVPLVPNEALILTGRAARVVVQDDTGRFRPVAIRSGRHDAHHTEVLDGLTGGERVVVSGQFLIDSEASLSGAMSRLEPAVSSDDGATSDEHDGGKPRP